MTKTFWGGVFILVRKSNTSSEEPKFVTDCEAECVKVKMKNQKDLHRAFYTHDQNPKDLGLQRTQQILK